MNSPEKHNFRPAVDAIGNNAAKMATLMLLAERPEEAFSQVQLGRAFMAMQGRQAGWVLGRGGQGIPFTYCERGMAPTLATAVEVPSQQPNRTARAYQINKAGLEQGVPLSGAWLQWELKHGETSTAQLL